MNANNHTLFVGDLSIFCTEDDIREEFSKLGELVEVKIIRCEETKKNLSYGFVRYANPESAVQAIEVLHGAMLCGRPMRVRWASRRARNELGSGPSFSQSNERSSVHVTYSSHQIDNVVTEEYFVKTFSRFGQVVDAAVKRFEINEELHFQKGYGFVHFAFTPEGMSAAMRCCEEMHNATIDKVTYKCAISHRLRQSLTPSQDWEYPRAEYGYDHGSFGEDLYPEYGYPPVMLSYSPALPFNYGCHSGTSGVLVPVQSMPGYPHGQAPLTHGYSPNGHYATPLVSPVTSGSAFPSGLPYQGRYMPHGYPSLLPFMSLASMPAPQSGYYFGNGSAMGQPMMQPVAFPAYWYPQMQAGGTDSGSSEDSPDDCDGTDPNTGATGEEQCDYTVPVYPQLPMSAAAIAAAVHGESPYDYTHLVAGHLGPVGHQTQQQQGDYQRYPTYPTELPQAYTQAVANGTLPASVLGVASQGQPTAWSQPDLPNQRQRQSPPTGQHRHASAAPPKAVQTTAGRRNGNGATNGRSSPGKRTHTPKPATAHPAPTLMAFLPAALTAAIHAAPRTRLSGQGAGRAKYPHDTAQGSLVYALRHRSKGKGDATPTSSLAADSPATTTSGSDAVSTTAAAEIPAPRPRPRGPDVPTAVHPSAPAAAANLLAPSPGTEESSPYPPGGNEASAIDSSGLSEAYDSSEPALVAAGANTLTTSVLSVATDSGSPVALVNNIPFAHKLGY